MNLADIRREYGRASLDVSDVAVDPFVQFGRWFSDAERAGLTEPNAMTLSTASLDAVPSARVVLLKDVSDAGFSFFTDYRSRKGAELEANPRAALVFLWKELERQVRVEGVVSRVPPEVSDAYFASRPLGSQYGAWASVQSSVLPDRAALERGVADVEARFAGGAASRPPHWGGYRLAPREVEFWQGRSNRLHDRVCYRLEEGRWVIVRLAP